MDEKTVREKINKHKIVHLTPKTQDFWNGPSCEIIVENLDNYKDLIGVLKEAKEMQD